MDQYFAQIEKLVAQAGTKKISSRIKFALKDVMDLRTGGWKARRDVAGPKTIDQIHKEAAAADQESQRKDQMFRMQGQGQQQRPNQNRGGGMDRGPQPRGGPPGRDSPNVRGGGAAPDAWQSVPSKGARNISQTPIDAGRFKALNRQGKDSDTISLGPGGMRPSAWAMGASGGNSRPGSGGNTPTSELDKKQLNRYDVLQDTSISNVPDTRRGGRGSQVGSRGSNRGTPNGSTTPTQPRRAAAPDERSAALRAAKEIVGGQRLQSPAPSAAPSSTGSDSPITTPSHPELSRDVVKKKTVATIDELISSGTEKEAQQCILDLQCPQMHHVIVEESINHVLEKKPQDRRRVGDFLNYVSKNGVIDVTQLVTGFAAVADAAMDIAVDVPHVYKYLGEILAPIVSDGNLPLNKVKDILECLIKRNKAGLVMAETLSECVKITQSENTIASMWQSSGLTWKSLLKEGYPVEEFIEDKKMEFTQKPCSSTTSHASHVQKELFELLKNKRDNNSIFTFFEGKVPKATQSTPEFIQDLSYTICKSTIVSSGSGGCSCDEKQLEGRCNLLLKFIDRNKTLELHCLYSLQKLANDYDHPKDLLRSMCHVLYSHKVLTEDTFYAWESSKDFPEGKGVAVSSLKSYLSWLREADEESNDDETPAAQS
jgi:translation initiation factor 4G